MVAIVLVTGKALPRAGSPVAAPARRPVRRPLARPPRLGRRRGACTSCWCGSTSAGSARPTVGCPRLVRRVRGLRVAAVLYLAGGSGNAALRPAHEPQEGWPGEEPDPDSDAVVDELAGPSRTRRTASSSASADRLSVRWGQDYAPSGRSRYPCAVPPRHTGTTPGPGGRTATLLSRRDRDRQDQRRWVISMRQYELMVILDPELDERTVAPSLDKFLTVVTKDGGTVDNVDIWGRRRLAYEIKKKSEGIYAVVNLTAEPATAQELDRQLEPQRVGHADQAAAPRRLTAHRTDHPHRRRGTAPWLATPSSRSSATSPATRSCASPRPAPRSRTSPWPPRRARSTARATSGRTARRCSCAARCGATRRRTSPSRCSAARASSSPAA